MQVVVAVAIVHENRVLAARRSTPPALAGGWELPGGKVEPGESSAVAAVREIAEELGCTIEVTGALEGAVPIADDVVLHGVTARLVRGDPVPAEHDAIRWLVAEQLDAVVWLAADRPFVAQLSGVLARSELSWPR